MNTAEIRNPVRGVGVLILLVGIWGGTIPFVGPLFSFNMDGSRPWVWSESHATLHVAPAIVAIIGAVLLMRFRDHRSQVIGAVLATLGGAWFVLAPSLHPLWAPYTHGMMMKGGSSVMKALEAVGYHYGTGVVIVALGAYALGRILNRNVGVPQGAATSSLEPQDGRSRQELVEA